MKPSIWTEYSKKFKNKVLSPSNCGVFDPSSEIEQMRIVQGSGENEDGWVLFSLIVDETDGVIADAKFLAEGTTFFIGFADVTCDLLVRKTYEQGRRLSADFIEKHLSVGTAGDGSLSQTYGALNAMLEGIEIACEQCLDIALKSPDQAPPVPTSDVDSDLFQEDPQWPLLSEDEKIEKITAVIEKEIQPYIALDAGGVRVLELKNSHEVIVAYEGACTSCPSATGATLHAIEQTLRRRLSPTLVVKPDLSFLN